MYTGSGGSAWGQFRLPHQVTIEIPLCSLSLSLCDKYNLVLGACIQFNSPRVAAGSSSGSQMDFLSELRRAMHHDANASSAT